MAMAIAAAASPASDLRLLVELESRGSPDVPSALPRQLSLLRSPLPNSSEESRYLLSAKAIAGAPSPPLELEIQVFRRISKFSIPLTPLHSSPGWSLEKAGGGVACSKVLKPRDGRGKNMGER